MHENLIALRKNPAAGAPNKINFKRLLKKLCRYFFVKVSKVNFAQKLPEATATSWRYQDFSPFLQEVADQKCQTYYNLIFHLHLFSVLHKITLRGDLR